MPAPTALLGRQEELAKAQAIPLPQDSKSKPYTLSMEAYSGNPDDDDLIIDTKISTSATQSATLPAPKDSNDIEMQVDEEGLPKFPPAQIMDGLHRSETRKVLIPPHRMTPLKTSWPKIYPPLVEHLKLQVRMNIKSRAVEIRTSKHTTDSGALQKGEDFVKAFSLGFDVDDAIALLRLDDLYIETFEIKDVKTLTGEHLGRAIGRIAGKDGKTKFAIENASRTRVVLADQKIHILGGFRNIHIARESIVSLILGAPPVSTSVWHQNSKIADISEKGKVYGNLRTVASRMKERF